MFSDSKFYYHQLSRMAKQTSSYSIVSKNDTEILLQLRHAAKTEATSLLDDEVVLASERL